MRLYSKDDEPAVKLHLPHKHDIITLLGVGGHWVTTEENLQVLSEIVKPCYYTKGMPLAKSSISSNYTLGLKEWSFFSVLGMHWSDSIQQGSGSVRMSYSCIFKLYFILHFYGCVHVYMQERPEVNIWSLPLLFSTLSFERGSLTEFKACQFG